MPTPRHLRNAPITEALLDIRVKAAQATNPANFSLPPSLQDAFPKREELRAATIELQFTPKKPPAVEEHGLQGFFFKSEDERVIAQFRTDGFTLNRLKPYTSWDDFFSRAKELWNSYIATAHPEAVTRVALRYINHIPLPSDGGHLANYMRVPPQIPEELPQDLGAFFWRITIHNVEESLSAHITQSLEFSNEVFTLLIDIDAFRNVDWTPNDPRVYEALNSLRGFKNRIFFGLLTDEAIRRFE